jgi:hypothetical protein
MGRESLGVGDRNQEGAAVNPLRWLASWYKAARSYARRPTAADRKWAKRQPLLHIPHQPPSAFIDHGRQQSDKYMQSLKR